MQLTSTPAIPSRRGLPEATIQDQDAHHRRGPAHHRRQIVSCRPAPRRAPRRGRRGARRETVDATPSRSRGGTWWGSRSPLAALVPARPRATRSCSPRRCRLRLDLVAFVAAAIPPPPLPLLDEVNGEASHYVRSSRPGGGSSVHPRRRRGVVRRRGAPPPAALGSLERIERGDADALLAVRTDVQKDLPGCRRSCSWTSRGAGSAAPPPAPPRHPFVRC